MGKEIVAFGKSFVNLIFSQGFPKRDLSYTHVSAMNRTASRSVLPEERMDW